VERDHWEMRVARAKVQKKKTRALPLIYPGMAGASEQVPKDPILVVI